MSTLLSLLRAGHKPVVGMVQLAPLPGGSRYRDAGIDDVLGAALAEADILCANGIDALMVQNLGDIPRRHACRPGAGGVDDPDHRRDRPAPPGTRRPQHAGERRPRR